MKQLYIRGVRAVGTPLRATGLLDRLERQAPQSRAATWAASLFAIHDLDGLRTIGDLLARSAGAGA